MSWKNIHAFCLSPDKKIIYAGTYGGDIICIDALSFQSIGTHHIADGGIPVLTHHNTRKELAVLGKDRHVYRVKIHDSGELEAVARRSTRISILPKHTEKRLGSVHSTSQALCYDLEEDLIIVRTACGALMELKPADDQLEIVTCYRLPQLLDLVTTRAIGNRRRLTGNTRGQVFLHEQDKLIQSWKFGDESIHWFEPVSENEYLIAGDTRKLYRLNIESGQVRESNYICRDDLEHVHYEPKQNIAYVTSFDRHLYLLDPDELTVIDMISLPFKLRWIKTLNIHPNLAIVQCRNGGLYQVDTRQKKITRRFKETPPALWTSALTENGTILIAGEGPRLLEVKPTHPSQESPYIRRSCFELTPLYVSIDDDTYVKRLEKHPTKSLYAMACVDGNLVLDDRQGNKWSQNLDSPIRDICFSKDGESIFIALENGQISRIHLADPSQMKTRTFAMPVWALALSPDGKKLACSERMGRAYILDSANLAILREIPQNRLAKRMKWISDNELFYGCSGLLYKYDDTNQTSRVFVASLGNTCEDFDWDEDRRYLVLVNYNKVVGLCDFATGEQLDVCADRVGYSKGVRFLKRFDKRWPLEFITYGRDGIPAYFQIYNERIMAYGPIKDSL